jgi:uncharacterized membrane protein YfcA
VAVPAATVVGLLTNGLTLVGERRRPVVQARVALVLLGASLPGMALGAVVLASAPEDVLRVAIAAVVAGTVIAYALARDGAGGHSSALGAGLLAGVLSTTSGINGPPLVLHLRRAGVAAAEMRDTLAAFFLVSGVLTLAALAVAGALRLPGDMLVLLAGAVAGQAIGRLAFRRLEEHRDAATLGVLGLSAAAAVVPVVQALG